MKKRFLAIFIITFLTLPLISCNPDNDNSNGNTTDNGNKNISAKFRFSDSTLNQNASIVLARNTNEALASTVIFDADSFSVYNDAYANLGNRISSIDPLSVKLAIMELVIYHSDGQTITLVDAGEDTPSPIVNFVNPTTFEIGEVQSGYYHAMALRLGSPVGYEFQISEISLPFPDDLDPTFVTSVYGNLRGKLEDGIWTLSHMALEHALLRPKEFSSITFAGNTYMMTEEIGVTVDGIIVDEHIHGKFVIEPMGVLVPFEGINIPEDANSVLFEISWDLDGLIERYENDIFVLKKGWIEGFSIRAIIE
jgi:hypothetical protein